MYKARILYRRAMLTAITFIAMCQQCFAGDALPKAFLSDCKFRDTTKDYYPETRRRTDTEGRLLLIVEKTSKGRVHILEVAKSEPAGAFDAATREIFSNFRCAKSRDAIKGKISVTFSLDPGPKGIHFEDVDDALEVRGTRILKPEDFKRLGVIK